jgi:FtsZ-binding cell division protein ZapB
LPEPDDCNCSRTVEMEVIEASPATTVTNDLAIAMECNRVKEHNAVLLLERDRAFRERDEVVGLRDDAILERAVALEDRDRAYADCDAAKAARYKAVVERDAALNTSDDAARVLGDLKSKISALEAELKELRIQHKAVQEKKDKLDKEKPNSQALLSSLAENVAWLQSRVSTLETQSSRPNTMSVSGGNPMRYIQLFTAKLFPDMVQRERENELFNVLYGNKKSFRKYVKRAMKARMLPELKLEICREIKKYYAAWKFLAVMDGSNQSLNQVSCVCSVLFLLFDYH